MAQLSMFASSRLTQNPVSNLVLFCATTTVASIHSWTTRGFEQGPVCGCGLTPEKKKGNPICDVNTFSTICKPIYFDTQAGMHSLIHARMHSLTNSLHACTYSLTHSHTCTHALTHMHSLMYARMHSLTKSLHACTHSLTLTHARMHSYALTHTSTHALTLTHARMHSLI